MTKINLKGNGVFTIEVNGLEVGAGYMMMAESEDDFTYLERLDINEEHQNKGYGTQALRSLREQIGNYYLSPDNEDAKRLYERLGQEIDDNDYNRFGFAIDNGFGVYEM